MNFEKRTNILSPTLLIGSKFNVGMKTRCSKTSQSQNCMVANVIYENIVRWADFLSDVTNVWCKTNVILQ